MKNFCQLALAITMIVVFTITIGCAPKQIQVPSEEFEPTCIQGRVWYRSPIDSSKVPYPYVKVTAFRHGTDQAFGETKTDKTGNYCIAVPLGDYSVDLRVWGLVPISGTHYICNGSFLNIGLGTTPKKCGEDCIKADIGTECREFKPIRRR